jgi:hypothetical protein
MNIDNIAPAGTYDTGLPDGMGVITDTITCSIRHNGVVMSKIEILPPDVRTE